MVQLLYLVVKYLLRIRRQNRKSDSICSKSARPILHALGAASWSGGAEPADAGGHSNGGLQGRHRGGAAVVALYPAGAGGAICIIHSYRGLRCGVSVARGRDLDDNELTCIIK